LKLLSITAGVLNKHYAKHLNGLICVVASHAIPMASSQLMHAHHSP